MEVSVPQIDTTGFKVKIMYVYAESVVNMNLAGKGLHVYGLWMLLTRITQDEAARYVK
jgi:hypothetical protein